MNKTVNIFFSIDDAYAPFLATAINSAIKNSSCERNYRAIVLYKDLSEENRTRISKLSTDNFKIEFVPMNQSFECIQDRMSNRLRCDYFTLTIYFRLFIPEMFKDLDKAVYIDSDVVIAGDIAKLYDTDIGDCLIGACQDKSVADVPPLVRYMEDAVGVNAKKYINSGVLLMNLKRLRELELGKHFLNLLSTYHFDSIAPDQDYLNAICADKIYYLDECWDAMPNDNKPPLECPMIVHYNLFSKPWCYDNIQYGELFWHYAEDSGYLDEIKAYKGSYSDAQKEQDSKCLELLIKRGVEITQNDITFKKMNESGVKIRL